LNKPRRYGKLRKNRIFSVVIDVFLGLASVKRLAERKLDKSDSKGKY